MGIGVKARKERDPPCECEYLTVRDVARKLGVSMAWVYQRVGTKESPPHVRIGLFIKFPKDEFQQWRQRIGDQPNV